MLWIAEFHFYIVWLDKNHPSIENDENSYSFQNYVNDPLFKKQKVLENILKTPSFLKTRILATKIIDDYREINHLEKSKS